MRVFGFGGQRKVEQYRKIGAWLKKHPELWFGKRIERNTPEWIAIAKAVKSAGFYSPKTVDCDVKVDKLIGFARRHD